MSSFDPQAYGAAMSPLLAIDRCRALDGGAPDRDVPTALGQLSLAEAFAPERIRDETAARACLAGLWLLHDCIDESHAVSQGIDTPSGSFWHGIMHRREGDFGNSKYWFRRVGDHPAYESLPAAAASLAATAPQRSWAERLAPGGRWDPYALVDACQAALRDRGDLAPFCRRVQQAEWESLWDFCYRSAIG
ncbi:MAG: hypothetical protein KF688_09505 [Pirellulales bacterium]|nr:hypothetical protein [Pirellulales bacterium]